jgi:hypothetical protein
MRSLQLADRQILCQSVVTKTGCAALLMFVCVTVGTGCKSASPSEAKAADRIVIEDCTLPQIRQAAISVFVKEGYDLRKSFDREVVCDRRANAMHDLMYGGLLSSKTWLRVRLLIEEGASDSKVLTCESFVVSSRDDTVFEEEQKPLSGRRKQNRKLLMEIQSLCHRQLEPRKAPEPER